MKPAKHAILSSEENSSFLNNLFQTLPKISICFQQSANTFFWCNKNLLFFLLFGYFLQILLILPQTGLPGNNLLGWFRVRIFPFSFSSSQAVSPPSLDAYNRVCMQVCLSCDCQLFYENLDVDFRLWLLSGCCC